MLEIVVSETQKVFVKAIKKFAKDALLCQTQVSFLLSLKDGAEGKEVKYEVCHEYVPIRETNIKEILGVKKIDFKGYSYFIPPRIKQILEDFTVVMESDDVEVAVFMNREDEDKIRYFLYSGGTYVKEFNLEDVLKFEIEQT